MALRQSQRKKCSCLFCLIFFDVLDILYDGCSCMMKVVKHGKLFFFAVLAVLWKCLLLLHQKLTKFCSFRKSVLLIKSKTCKIKIFWSKFKKKSQEFASHQNILCWKIQGWCQNALISIWMFAVGGALRIIGFGRKI